MRDVSRNTADILELDEITKGVLMNYLTQEEVDNLPIGTKIIVTWGGGNGPAERIITEKWNGHCITDIGIKNGYLDFVGTEKMQTKVSLVTPPNSE